MPTEMSIPGVGGDRKREAVGQRLGRAEPAPGKSPDGGFVWIILNAFREARQTARKKKKLHRNKVSSHETMMDRKPPLKGGLKGLAEFSFTAKQKKPKDRRRSKKHAHTHISVMKRSTFSLQKEGRNANRTVCTNYLHIHHQGRHPSRPSNHQAHLIMMQLQWNSCQGEGFRVRL